MRFVFALACLFACPVMAQEGQQGAHPQCGPVAAIEAAKAAGVPLVLLDDAQRDRAVAAYNKIPDPSDIKPSRVWVIDSKDHRNLAFIFEIAPGIVCGMAMNGDGRRVIMEAIDNGTPS